MCRLAALFAACLLFINPSQSRSESILYSVDLTMSAGNSSSRVFDVYGVVTFDTLTNDIASASLTILAPQDGSLHINSGRARCVPWLAMGIHPFGIAVRVIG